MRAVRTPADRTLVVWLRALAAAIVLLAAARADAIQTPVPAAEPVQDTAACSKVWVGREQEYEEFLRTAPVEKIEEIGIGVTKPKRVFFAPGGLVRSAAWKPLRPGRYAGFWESYQSEIAAYEVDKMLGLHMIPPTVERRIDGALGALVMWVENVRGWKINEPVVGPDLDAWNRQVVAMKMFDDLIGNIDRNQGNLMYDPEYHLILIDHSRAFTGSKELPVKLVRVRRDLLERFDQLTLEQLQAALGRFMGKGEIKAIVARRDRLREQVNRMVADLGQARVYLP